MPIYETFYFWGLWGMRMLLLLSWVLAVSGPLRAEVKNQENSAEPNPELVRKISKSVSDESSGSAIARQPASVMAADDTARSVEELPVDRFDTYSQNKTPPYPWILHGEGQAGLALFLSDDAESPFVGNQVTGKGFVLRDDSESTGSGAGLATRFTPPPAGSVYLGFDFRLGLPGKEAAAPDLQCRLSGRKQDLLRITFSLELGAMLETRSGKQQLIRTLFPGNWYHIGITIHPDKRATFILFTEKDRETPVNLGTHPLDEVDVIEELEFVSHSGQEATGTWALDNVCMAGEVEASRKKWLPFQQLPTKALRASGKKVFAYYYPIYSSEMSSKDPGLSWYVRSVMNPTLLNDPQRAPAGTRQFYQPLPRPPIKPGKDRQAEYVTALEEEVRIAIQMGLDGFVLDFFGVPTAEGGQRHFNKVSFALMEAAQNVDSEFKIIPAIYPDSKIKGLIESGHERETAAMHAGSEVMTRLQEYSNVLRVDGGKMLFSVWLPERYPALWWKMVIEELEKRGISSTFMPQFNSKTHLDEYAPFSYAMANWGPRTPVKYVWVEQARKYDPLVIAPIASHDIRSRGCSFWESCNFDTLRSTWKGAIAKGADWAELNTWSDYSEQAMAPSTSIGFALHDLNTYYIQWFKTGSQPQIVRDTLYYSYRINHSAVVPGIGKKWGMQPEGGFKEPKNEIELLAFLKQPGVLEIQVGNDVYRQQAAAGITSFKAPLPYGAQFTPTFRLMRDGNPIIDRKGRYTVLDKVDYQNMLYHSGVLVPQN